MSEILKLYPYQEDGVEKTLELKKVLNGDAPGLGKEQPYSEPILTPKGWVEMGSLKVGDTIIAGDGSQTKVTAIYEQGEKQVYKVTFTDGTYTRCGLHHLWNVRTSSDPSRRGANFYRTLELANIIGKYKTRMYDKRYPDSVLYKYNYSIPLCGKVQYDSVAVPLNGYVLGVILGDGNISNGRSIRISKPSPRLREKVVGRLGIDGDCVTEFGSDGMTFLIKNKKYRTLSHTTNILKSFGLMGLKSKEKFIPRQYLMADVDTREQLLEGLLETDGHVIKEGVWEYSTASEKLKDGFCELARSLGYIVRFVERESYYEKEGERFRNFRIYIYGKGARKIKSICDIQEDGIEKQRCIVVDHPSHLYITRDFIVTHNTAQSIVAVERAKATPCLVVCPASLKINWEREVKKFTNLRPLILTDAMKATFPYFIGTMDLYDVVIVNYESLKKYFVVKAEKPYKLKDIVFQNVIRQFKSVILDESHRVKDPSTLAARLCMGICKDKEYVICLSGTPVINDPTDLASQLCIMGQIGVFGGYKDFILQYGDGKNLQELNDVIHEHCYFRREKESVLKDLPELTRSKVVTELSPDVREEYNVCEKDLRAWLLDYKNLSDEEAKRKLRMKALVQFMNLRTLAGKGKVDATIQMVRDMGGEPVIIFCEHHDIVDRICEAFPDAVCVTGRQNAVQKQAAVDAFQAGKRKVLVCSIKAAGVGLTLTASSNVIFTELPWTMSDLQQCEARAHRNGQKNAVTSWVLIGAASIDSYLYNLIMDKGATASKITGEVDAAIKDVKYFDELAELFMNGNKGE